jgi:hypothetical protein
MTQTTSYSFIGSTGERARQPVQSFFVLGQMNRTEPNSHEVWCEFHSDHRERHQRAMAQTTCIWCGGHDRPLRRCNVPPSCLFVVFIVCLRRTMHFLYVRTLSRSLCNCEMVRARSTQSPSICESDNFSSPNVRLFVCLFVSRSQ